LVRVIEVTNDRQLLAAGAAIDPKTEAGVRRGIELLVAKPQRLVAGIGDANAIGARVRRWAARLEIHGGPTPVLKAIDEVVRVEREIGLRGRGNGLVDGIRRGRVIAAGIDGGNGVCPSGQVSNGGTGGRAANDGVGAEWASRAGEHNLAIGVASHDAVSQNSGSEGYSNAIRGWIERGGQAQIIGQVRENDVVEQERIRLAGAAPLAGDDAKIQLPGAAGRANCGNTGEIDLKILPGVGGAQLRVGGGATNNHRAPVKLAPPHLQDKDDIARVVSFRVERENIVGRIRVGVSGHGLQLGLTGVRVATRGGGHGHPHAAIGIAAAAQDGCGGVGGAAARDVGIDAKGSGVSAVEILIKNRLCDGGEAD